ncbi:MAG TPA: hypothetical protein VKE26_26335 [Xanthobacteraceae bacterium]|nr:hypothetical protein [Xanthobacteraceae bacterium]
MTKDDFVARFDPANWPTGGEDVLAKFRDFALLIYDEIPPEPVDFHAVAQPLFVALTQLYRVRRIRGL